MSDPAGEPEVPIPQSGTGMFSGPQPEPAKRGYLVGLIAVVVLTAAIGGVALLHRSPAATAPLNTVQPADPYAGKILFSQLAMSESTSLSGGKSTFMDGHVRNAGSDTITGATVQVLFKNDEGMSPTVESIPLSIIRTHEPYVDTEPLSAAPLKPGDDVEFRMIFETVPANWNQQMPELVVVHVSRR